MILYEMIIDKYRFALELEKGLRDDPQTNDVYILKMISEYKINIIPPKTRSVFRVCLTEQEYNGILD